MRNVRQELAAVSAQPDVLLPQAGIERAGRAAQEGNRHAPEAFADGGAVGACAVRVAIPWPPGVNHIWRSIVIRGSVRVLLSKEGRQYRDAVKNALNAFARIPAACFAGPVAVHIDAYPPDRRRRDVDNLAKAALDALTHAGLWEDDSQIADLRIRRGAVVPGGRLEVHVVPLPVQQERLL